MSAHPPIGACCYRPGFNAVGGVDDFPWASNLQGSRPGIRTPERMTVPAVAGILAILAVAIAYTLLWL